MTVRQVVRASLRLLDPRDRRLLVLAVGAQMLTALLDLFGVMLVGIIGALGVTAVAGEAPPRRLTAALSALGIDSASPSTLIAIIAGVAAAALIAKSIISPLLLMRVVRFLASRETGVSAKLTRELLSRPLTFVQKRSSQETSAALIQSTNAAIMIVLSQTVMACSEVALLGILAVALLSVKPSLAIAVIAFFGVVGFGLQRVLGHRAARFEADRMDGEIASKRALQEAIGAYREITVADRRAFVVERVKRLRSGAAQSSASRQLVALLPKYLSEAALVLGAVSMAAWLFSTEPIGVAAGTFAVFLAAASRIMPSLLRLQGATLSIRGAAGSASRAYDLADDLDRTAAEGRTDRRPQTAPTCSYPDFLPTIDLDGVCFTYPGSDIPAVREVTLAVGVGESVALVGRSGAGKSTLADLILGVLTPDSGLAQVGGLPPAEAITRWPGGIAYVPQDVMLTNESIRNNVALGLPAELIDDGLVWSALNRAQLDAYVRSQPDGLDTQIGERGLRLSGGQRQRLGIARALYTRPRLLVLDEATSALDAETEQSIASMLSELREDVTTVIIAHRLSTVRHADVVVYLDGGAVLATGTFDQVCSLVPALQRQAALMGLQAG